KRSNMMVPMSEVHSMWSPFNWVDGTDILAFADLHVESDVKTLVVVDLRDGPRAPVFTEILNEYCKSRFIPTGASDITRIPQTDAIAFTLTDCGRFEVRVPTLRP